MASNEKSQKVNKNNTVEWRAVGLSCCSHQENISKRSKV